MISCMLIQRFLHAGLLLSVMALFAAPAGALSVAADFPGGNIVVEEIAGDTVRLRQDRRDTEGWWFYWCFRVRGAAGRNIHFEFTDGEPVGVRGAAFSLDEGVTWAWLEEPFTASSFEYAFPEGADSVRFSFGMPYTRRELDAFLARHAGNPCLRADTLCDSRKGRNVERLHLGRPESEPRFRVLVTARSHACEMMASYAVEGLMEAALAEGADGEWLRTHAEILVIPFVDKDGVEDGDQGKNRRPHDHNRDYGPEGIYPETRALRAFVPEWSGGCLRVAMDLHCPWIRGGTNEYIYQVGSRSPENWEQQRRFAAMLEAARKGPLPYHASKDLPFGEAWNKAENYSAGLSGARWAGTLEGVTLATALEIPYANAEGAEVNQETARAFGRDLAAALRRYLESLGE